MPSGPAIAKPVTALIFIQYSLGSAVGEEFPLTTCLACRCRPNLLKATRSIATVGLSFRVKDVGWIPIDASRANKFPKDREYYFGTLGSTWVTLAHRRDVVLEPPQQGPPLNMLHGPVAEVDGKPFDLHFVAHYKDRREVAAK